MEVELELEKMQFWGILEIFQETIKLIHKWRKMFTKITLTFVLPLSLLTLAKLEISNLWIRNITHNQQILHHTQKFTPLYLKLSDLVISERIHYSLFYIAFSIFSAAFSLLSTSATVYTVASIYAARDVSFKHVIRAVPKLWKRLLLTFLCVLAALVAFNVIAFSSIFSIRFIVLSIHGENDVAFKIGSAIFLFFFVTLYFAAFWYLAIIWQLSSVVSALETSSCGFSAMARSRALLKGKMAAAVILVLSLSLTLGTVNVVFNRMVVRSGAPTGVVGKGILGIIWLLSFLVIVLIRLVAGIVLYFVCKSYHQESVDKSALFDHLQGYLSTGYVALEAEDDVHIIEKLQVV